MSLRKDGIICCEMLKKRELSSSTCVWLSCRKGGRLTFIPPSKLLEKVLKDCPIQKLSGDSLVTWRGDRVSVTNKVRQWTLQLPD